MFPEPSGITQPVAFASPLLPATEEDLLSRFVDRAPVPLLVADDERRLLRVNDAWAQLFGYSADQVRNMRIDDLLAPESKPGIGMRWSDLIAAGAATARVRLILADGERAEIRYSAVANILPGMHLALFLGKPSAGGAPQRPGRSRRPGQLTVREQESLRLVAVGMTTTAAAERLGISPETVRTHVRNAMNKLGARTRAQAIAIAMRDGEIPG
ncbi:MAG: LuxR C-terminal-related transcriptional regulator [Thermoleophilaceae bacterium]